MPWGIYAASPAWQELAYSVVAATEYAQFSRPVDTFGPRWTSLMDPVRVPVMLARDYGSGSVVLAQLGSWYVHPKEKMNSDRLQEAPEHLRKLAENLVGWAAGR
jgi:aminoglycoside/choline kinase family phosphotransferase